MSLDRAISLVQLASIIGGIAYFGIEAGRRDEKLLHTSVEVDELARVVADLAKTQYQLTTGQALSQRELDSLQHRIDRLETGVR